MNEVEIPRYIDSQYQFFFWEMDEIAPLIFLMGLGMVSDTLSMMFVIMILFSIWFRRFKREHFDGVLLHLAWWIGALPLNKFYDNGAEREWVE